MVTCRFRAQVKKLSFVVTIASIIVSGCYILPMCIDKPLDDVMTPPEYTDALLRLASPDSILLLSVGDLGFADFAVNLYKTSYAKFGLTNHLFAALDGDLCPVLVKEGANCVQYLQMNNAHLPSEFGTVDFKKKVYMKTKIVLDALMMNISVIFVDLDIVFLKDPRPHLTCEGCDLMIQPDGLDNNVNTGFYLIHPTPASLELMTRSWTRMSQMNPTFSKPQQYQFNYILSQMTSQGHIHRVILDKKLFPNGRDYFLQRRRPFRGDNPCTACVIIHNNWSLCKARKRYRFKEHGLWLVDNNGYYSAPDRKYLVYDNPVDFDRGRSETSAAEHRALRTAFIAAHILNRTLIMPKFHSENHWQNFGFWYDLSVFDVDFMESYREHVFLESELVPESVKSSVSDTFIIHSKSDTFSTIKEPPSVKVLWSANGDITVAELTSWFGGDLEQKSVLKFHSLYNSIKQTEEISHFTERLDKSLRRKVHAVGSFCIFSHCLWRTSPVMC